METWALRHLRRSDDSSVSGLTRTLTLNYFKGSKQTRGGARQKGEDAMRQVHRAVAPNVRVNVLG